MMRLNTLLTLFEALDRSEIDFVVVGSLATTLRGERALTEDLQIVVPRAGRDLGLLRTVLKGSLPDADIVVHPSEHVLFRVLPRDTPLYFEFIGAEALPLDRITLNGVDVPVARLPEASRWASSAASLNLRGFALAERFEAVNSLAREMVPALDTPRGVRKFRSFEDLKVDSALYQVDRRGPELGRTQ